MTRWSIVAVYDQPVTCSASMSCITFSGSKRPVSQTERTPLTMKAIVAMCSPETWKSGYVTSWQTGIASGGAGFAIAMRAPWKNDSPSAAAMFR